ncbi:MAG TPA: DUF3613 domain-containing protein [Stenotrophomonas sp.]
MSRTAPLAVILLVGTLWATQAIAQHAPLIERMTDATAPVANTNTNSDASAITPPSAATPAFAIEQPRSQIGDTTRALLQMQADGSRAGNALPMLGEAASRSYQRYLKSFDHPIPEYFEAALPDSKQGGGSR